MAMNTVAKKEREPPFLPPRHDRIVAEIPFYRLEDPIKL